MFPRFRGSGRLGWRMGGRRRGRYWREPERLAGQAARDRELGRRAFYVYVLVTDYGYYVGHTWNVGNRVRQHQRGEVESTAGGNPELVWTSRAYPTRDDAAGFEAALKSLRDQRSYRFQEITGLEPWAMRRPVRSGGGGCLGLFLVLALVVVLMVL